jgi:four helix bundle protein
MMGFKFESLDVWKRSVDFADAMFEIAETIPQRYQFSLGEQLRRAALSIPTNIAEGSGRDKPKEKQYFFRIAKGSVYEVVSLMVMMGKRSLLDADDYREHRREANEIAAILTALSNAPL